MAGRKVLCVRCASNLHIPRWCTLPRIKVTGSLHPVPSLYASCTEITAHNITNTVEEHHEERTKTHFSLDINLIITRLSIAVNRRVVNRFSHSTSRIGLTTSRCASPRHACDLSSTFSKILSTFHQDHHCFVAECWTHFPQLLVWEGKKKMKLGLKLGKELRWGWVFFKSRLQNDVRRFGRGLAGLFS